MTLFAFGPTRHLLAAAAALLTASAQAQQTPPANQPPADTPTQTPAIAGVVAAGTPVQFIKQGFKGTEGPLGLPDGGFIFTETQDKRITRIAADGQTSPFLENSNGSNGLGLSASGELYAVQVDQPRVGVVYPLDKARTLADSWEGKPFGRPNDLVLDSRGNVYFTDSGVIAKPGEPENAVAAVYRISAAGKLERLAADITRPNGIQLSPDEKTLYVADTAGEYVLAYDLRADGSIGPRRNFAKLEGWRKLDNGQTSSGADGLAVDAQGRLFVASTVGIQVFNAKGEPQGVITLPRAPQNLAFAGPGKSTLYVVGRGSAYKIATQTAGYAGRAK
ncbi:SMP-30/gluconolactonase/LRE family protein [Paucibacter sp. TC2R-5]|uniref:SMP-30/gluconolactonase/LRE family protein n=1 Tax=Paucibacter sp. TC2R-5 TaxID=2893555 RepID=UPI0021E46810|nr:SMP-30/gluconolactonase/LRE family protein [Paucibacter sp. TC2R-5]MCV2361276.1 SMP-30/gluconolactonase/LRE family protein [Paucibacter sp. TC2R-5]